MKQKIEFWLSRAGEPLNIFLQLHIDNGWTIQQVIPYSYLDQRLVGAYVLLTKRPYENI